MTTIIRGPRPPAIEAWLERRKRLGQDRFDEVWEGRYVVAPEAHSNHSTLQLRLADLLRPAARRLGLLEAGSFNLGEPGDFRVPDAGLIVRPGVWHDTAVLVVQILSPDDETFAKLDFYTAHSVRELLVLDWQPRTARVFALQESQAERGRSEVLGMTTEEIVAVIDWPLVDDEPVS